MALTQCESPQQSVDVQGHRGCRGLFPENTIPAFLHAVDLGVTTLELDVVITKDNEVIVSHEPFLSHEICLDTTSIPITQERERLYNLYTMTYDEVRVFDCGSKVHPRFPDQQKQALHKPRLREVIEVVEKHVRDNGLKKVAYNIETKCTPEGDRSFHPEPAVFTDLLMDVVNTTGIANRTILQSFDVRTLQHAHAHYPDIPLALLVENAEGPAANVQRLGFVPAIYSCDYTLLDDAALNYCRENGMQVIPWTVNEEADIQRLLNWGVDGIISDYPDRVLHLLEQKSR